MAKIQSSLLRLWFYSIVLAFFTIWPEKLLFHAKVILIYNTVLGCFFYELSQSTFVGRFCRQCAVAPGLALWYPYYASRLYYASREDFLVEIQINKQDLIRPSRMEKWTFFLQRWQGAGKNSQKSNNRAGFIKSKQAGKKIFFFLSEHALVIRTPEYKIFQIKDLKN